MSDLPLSEARIAEIAERAAKATPGPWEMDDDFSRHHMHYDEGERHVVSIETGSAICGTTHGWENPNQSPANAEFIAHARSDVPALLMALRTANARAEGLAEALRDARTVFGEVVETLRKEAPGTPLNNHRFDALGMRANKVLARIDAALKEQPNV